MTAHPRTWAEHVDEVMSGLSLILSVPSGFRDEFEFAEALLRAGWAHDVDFRREEADYRATLVVDPARFQVERLSPPERA